MIESGNLLIDKSILSAVETFMRRPQGGVLLCGSKGQGKYLLARQMAVTMLGIEDEADLINHPDFVEITSHDAVIKMNELEPVRKAAASVAVNAKQKVFLIDDAELMTPNAQNSLLKLLEDMNNECVVLMVCHADVLQTIRSRCHVIEFYPQTDDTLQEYLRKRDILVNELTLAIAGGCLGKYFNFCERRNYLLDVRNFFSVLPRNNTKELLISLSLVKEKDTNNFFEKYALEDVRVFMSLLHDVLTEILLHLTTDSCKRKKYSSFIDFETAVRTFSADKIIGYQNILKQHLLRSEKKGAYTRNDFFDLIRHL